MTKKPLDPAWAAEIATITPLGQAPKAQAATPKLPQPTGPNTTFNPANPPYRPNIIGGWETTNPIPILSHTNECLAGRAPACDNQLWQRLKSGQAEPTLALDLHGYGEGDAWLELVHFLHEAQAHNHRCVLLIHGKGQGCGPNRDMGVIKWQTPLWLAAHPKVLAFHTAPTHHGGSGACLILLHRLPLKNS